MNVESAPRLLADGLWRNNPGVVQLLGLCPLLAVSTNTVNAACLGLATTLAMTVTGAVVAGVREAIPRSVRIPAFILVIAGLVTAIQLALNAYAHAVYVLLGIFIPLIVTNCLVLARVEAYASRRPPWCAALDGFAMGSGLTVVLVVLGAARELAGSGTLLAGLDVATGAQAKRWIVHLAAGDSVFPLTQTACGAFIGLGLLIALRNAIASLQKKA